MARPIPAVTAAYQLNEAECLCVVVPVMGSHPDALHDAKDTAVKAIREMHVNAFAVEKASQEGTK